MKIAVWKTNHGIADTVADAVAQGLKADILNVKDENDFIKNINNYDAHICYGILRRAGTLFYHANILNKPWFNIDNSYWGAGHFHGNYRINFKGTQSKYNKDLQKPHGLSLEYPNEIKGDTILIVPPSDYVCEFFNLKPWTYEIYHDEKYLIRTKDAKEPINWQKIKGVVTFNSTVGVEALRRGIPVISDTEHSMIGSYYKQMLMDKGLDYNFKNITLIDRESLFQCMSAHQFKLEELREGKSWTLLNYYLNSLFL